MERAIPAIIVYLLLAPPVIGFMEILWYWLKNQLAALTDPKEPKQ